VLALAAALLACRTPGALPLGRALEPDLRFAPLVPDAADHAAADLATAALARDAAAAAGALGRLRAIDRALGAFGDGRTGLGPAAEDLVNATLDDPRRYREATHALLREGAIDPALEARLEQSEQDDPLVLAAARVRDARQLDLGRAFNALAEPLGQSILSVSLAPYRLGRSALEYALAYYDRDPLPLQRRQALAHWKEFLARHPDAAEAEPLREEVDDAQVLLIFTLRNRALVAGEQALARGEIDLALLLAERALRLVPEDRRAVRLRGEAAEALRDLRARRRASLLAAPPEGLAPLPAAPLREILVALLDPAGDVAEAARALEGPGAAAGLGDEALFLAALAAGEDHDETGSLAELEELAEQSDARSNMARHARALLGDPGANPWGAFRRALWRHRLDRARWILFGPFAGGPRERGLPAPLEWLIDLPAAAQAFVATPFRLVQLPFARDLPAARGAAVHARRYLARWPGGERAAELREWLQGFEEGRENWIGALDVARARPEVGAEERARLESAAATQSLEVARREENRALRLAHYQRIALDYPETPAGRLAAERARDELERASAHYVRLSRGFLLENPELWGPRGLGLRPELLDGNPGNGELHPDGVALLGGRSVELHLLPPGGDEEAPAERVREALPEGRLARLVSQLEETSFRNSLLDADDPVLPDAQRDVFFERARLGLAEEADPRPLAEAVFTYRGLRERYGMVRARDSILPFELVLQGSLTDLSLGAFPRMKPPRTTPDAFLFR